MVLFEGEIGERNCGAGDNGSKCNASMRMKLVSGRRFVLRPQYARHTGDIAAMTR